MAKESIIDRIMAALSKIETPDGVEKIYRDEPIVTTAARAEEELPEKYREMKKIAAKEFGVTLGEWPLFYKQGKFMEDYEDSYEKKIYFQKFYPTYRQMNDRQLRAYFTWRTAVRRGEIKETYLSYVYVYMYELIHLIGCRDEKEALEKFIAFTDEYSKIEYTIRRYASRWAKDMRIYYGITEERTKDGLDGAVTVLSSPHGFGEEEVFGAICAASTFDPTRSKLYKTHPEEYRTLLCRTYTAFSDFCDRTRRQTLAERLFGKECDVPYMMFPSAVFYDLRKKTNRKYKDGAGRKFVCRNGEWRLIGRPVTDKKSSTLGSLMKTVDSLLRPYFGMEPTKPGKTVVTLGAIVEDVTEVYFAERREAEAKKVEINFEILDEIRTQSERTKDKLVSEEETEYVSVIPEQEEDYPEEEPASDGVTPLSGPETEILRAVIEGSGAAAAARSHGLMLSAAVDSINEKLFEFLFDTAIEFDGDAPVAVEDYIEVLKGYAGI